MKLRFDFIHPGRRVVIGAVAVVIAGAGGYQLFVPFSDATALQRAAGPDGTHLGPTGEQHLMSRTGRDWRHRALVRHAAASQVSAPVRVAAAP